MISFAIVENNKVINIVDTKENYDIAKKVLSMMFPDSTIVKINDDEKNSLYKGSEFLNNKFYDPRPHPSWVLKDDRWCPPTDIPGDGKAYFWNESEKEWQQYETIS